MEKRIAKCPCCGSEDRLFEGLADSLKERGIAREEWSISWDVRQGVVVDKEKEANIPIGSEVPGFLVKTDICTNCGCIYAIEMRTDPVKKTIVPGPPPGLPNRAERRRLHLPHGSNNPFMS